MDNDRFRPSAGWWNENIMDQTKPQIVRDGHTLGVIGAGVMGQALIKGILRSGLLARDRIWAGEKSQSTCEAAAASLGVPVETDFRARVRGADLILICVKPAQAGSALEALSMADLSPDALLVSIMAGTSTRFLESALTAPNPWVRAMPNTPSIVGEGMTVICAGKHASASHLERARVLFQAVGKCIAIDEQYFNAITALSGSGPAYIYLVIEALADAGVRVGLPRKVALELVVQTVVGAARMIQVTERHPASLRDDVTTPGGCTIGGLLMLEDGRIRSVLARAVEEAAKIAEHLGPPNTAKSATPRPAAPLAECAEPVGEKA
jgi:pyrroline-5-carboxylate reductase